MLPHASLPTRRLLRATLMLLCTCAPLPASAQSAAGDAGAKARTVVTFARYVEWPAERRAAEGGELRLCVVHNNPAVGDAFAHLDGQLVDGRRLTLAFSGGAPRGHCRLLYVDASAGAAAAAALAATAAERPFTLGSSDGFLAQGGMVEILVVDDRLRFDIALAPLRQAQFEIHPGVLKLARNVRR